MVGGHGLDVVGVTEPGGPDPAVAAYGSTGDTVLGLAGGCQRVVAVALGQPVPVDELVAFGVAVAVVMSTTVMVETPR